MPGENNTLQARTLELVVGLFKAIGEPSPQLVGVDRKGTYAAVE